MARRVGFSPLPLACLVCLSLHATRTNLHVADEGVLAGAAVLRTVRHSAHPLAVGLFVGRQDSSAHTVVGAKSGPLATSHA